VTGKIIQFPRRPDDGAWTEEEWLDDLADLHERLMDAFTDERADADEIAVTLSIDDMMQLCELIEQRLGPDHFSGEDSEP